MASQVPFSNISDDVYKTAAAQQQHSTAAAFDHRMHDHRMLGFLIGIVNTADPVNIEHILKTNFSSYGKVLRDGKWIEEDASVLVPGDIISVKLGDIIPADSRLLDGDPLKIDQVILEILEKLAKPDVNALLPLATDSSMVHFTGHSATVYLTHIGRVTFIYWSFNRVLDASLSASASPDCSLRMAFTLSQVQVYKYGNSIVVENIDSSL
ncbi:hypothetical protein ACFE04_017507 [Oxalis oulophora]